MYLKQNFFEKFVLDMKQNRQLEPSFNLLWEPYKWWHLFFKCIVNQGRD